MSYTVNLNWHEAAMASHVGWMRQLSAIKSGLVDRHGYDGEGWSEHIEGACGELAVAKLLGVFWDGSVNTWKANDLPGIQVRTRSKHGYDLLLRDDDADEARWVLVTGRCPAYVVHGWISGADAKRPEYLQAYGGRPPAFFVPSSRLRPIDELRPDRFFESSN